jgi:hypothetical protein
VKACPWLDQHMFSHMKQDELDHRILYGCEFLASNGPLCLFMVLENAVARPLILDVSWYFA